MAVELNKYGIDLAALSETRLAGQGELRETVAGYTFYWIENPEKDRREHIVGFAIADRLTSMMVSESNGVSPHLISSELKLEGGGFASVIGAYAPTMQYTEEEKDIFYAELYSTLRAIPKQDRIVLMGEFNARIERDSESWPGVLGHIGIGTLNRKVERLSNLYATHGLTISNTRFNL